MRILCLITVGAFVLSIAIAESDVPIGPSSQYQYNHQNHHHHHQRLPHPIILEPAVKLKSETGPLDWFVKMVSRIMEPLKKPSPAIIGPINLPGMKGQVYIRQMEDGPAWESNHIVIKMVTPDPLTGINVPVDSGQPYHHHQHHHNHNTDNYSRRQPNSYGYRFNEPLGRSKGMIQQAYRASFNGDQRSNWRTNYHQGNRHNSNFYAESHITATPNDFRHEDYAKTHREPYNSRFHASPSYPSDNYHNDNHQRFQSMSTAPYRDSGFTTVSSASSVYRPPSHQAPNEPIYRNVYDDKSQRDNIPKSQSNDFHFKKAVPLRSTQTPYPDYALRLNNEIPGGIVNDTRINELASSTNNFPPIAPRFRPVVRNDRMISNNWIHGSYAPPETTNYRGSTSIRDSPGFHQIPMTKFELDDVGGLEIIAPPNFMHSWNQPIANDLSNNQSERIRDSDLNDDEDSISMGNGQNLARGESTEHANYDHTESEKSVILPSRHLEYRVIDGSQRSSVPQNVSLLGSGRANFDGVNRFDDKKNRSNDSTYEPRDAKERYEARDSGMASEIIDNVSSTTTSNRWRFQERRKPTRVVKAIYRRRPTSEIVKKNNGESAESDGSSNDWTKNSEEISLIN